MAKLDVATFIADASRPPTVDELATATGAQPQPLGRLLRTLASLGVVLVDDQQRVTLTPVGATLSRRSPDSVRDRVLTWMETHYLPFSELLHSVTTGEPGATRYYGEPFFDWLAGHPDQAARFSSAMASLTTDLRAGMFAEYQLPDGPLVADVGGSDGSVLIELIQDRPEHHGVVFDLPSVVPFAAANVAMRGLTDRIEVVAGDFFVAVPPADVYLLSYIMHDWDDESASRILRNVATAGGEGARVLVVEIVVPEGNSPHVSKMVDLTMLGMATGRERTLEEYERLVAGAGLRLDRVLPTRTPFSIIEATVVGGLATSR